MQRIVADGVGLDSGMAKQLSAHKLVMLFELLPPDAVAKGGRVFTRTDDVGEQDGRQDPVRLVRLVDAIGPGTLQEQPDRLDDQWLARFRWDVHVALELDEGASRNLIREVAALVGRAPRVAYAVQAKRRHPNCADSDDVQLGPLSPPREAL